MNAYLIVGLILMIVIAGGVGYWFSSRKIVHSLSKGNIEPKANTQKKALETIEVVQQLQPVELKQPVLLDHELMVIDQDGRTLVRTSELTRMPEKAIPLTDRNNVAVKRATQLAAELFKGSASLPGKTIELVFDPHIKKGLYMGTLEIIPAVGGGTRLMARDVHTKTIAGHGRVLEGSRAVQVATGAYHILSIAVAQSHLDDINRNLDEIKTAIQDVKRKFEDKDKAKLRGTISYLEYLVAIMNDLSSPDQISIEKRHQLESIRRETMEWSEQLRYEAIAMKEKIDAQEDIDDWGGTENTFNAMKALAVDVDNLIEKRSLFLRMMALLEVGTTYIDPLEINRSSLSFMSSVDESMAAIESALASMRDRSHLLFAKSFWNKEETLQQRRQLIVLEQEKSRNNALEHQRQYQRTINMLSQHRQRILDNNQEVRMALTFDHAGDVSKVGLI